MAGKVWTKQPQRLLRIAPDWRPFVKGVWSGVDITKNMAKGSMLGDAVLNGTVGKSTGLVGQAATFAASADASVDVAGFLHGTQRSFAMIAVVRRSSAQLYRFAIRTSSLTTYDIGAGIACQYSGAGLMCFNIGLHNYDEYEINELVQLADNEIATYVGTWNADTQIAKLFKNGQLQGSLNYTSASNSPRSIALSVGNDPTSTAARNWNGDVFLAGFLDGLLNDGPAAKLSANPWQLFSRRADESFAPPSAAATYVFNPMSGRGGARAQPLAVH